MITQTQIDALITNKEAFGLMSEELQAAAKEIGCKEFDFLLGSTDGGWSIGEKDDFFRFYRTYHLRPDYEATPEQCEIIECEITSRAVGEGYHALSYTFMGAPHSLNIVPDSYVCVGFKFKGIKQIINKEFGYSHNDVDILPFVELDQIKSGKFKVLHATHILFRKTK